MKKVIRYREGLPGAEARRSATRLPNVVSQCTLRYMSRCTLLSVSRCTLLLLFALMTWTMAHAQDAAGGITATATAEVCGDGLKVTSLVLTYPEAIDGTRLDTASYRVEGRKVMHVYTSTSDQGQGRAESGPYVVLLLDKEVATTGGMGGGMRRPGGNGGPGAGGQGRPDGNRDGQAGPPRGDRPQGDARQGGERPQGGRPQGGGGGVHRAGQLFNDSPQARMSRWNDTVELTQVGTVYTARGGEVAPMTAALTVKSTRTLVADDFVQMVYPDAETGIQLRYNIYIPRGIKEGEVYPLVLFMHDASGAGKTDTRHAILQGNGATVWAEPRWQAKHPCFVLAPQFDTVTMDDDFNYSADLTACLNLLDALVETLPVDRDRIYTTGQSMGCMMSYEFLYRRPDFFASAMLVAGQWDPAKMAPLSKMNLWIISCSGDDRSSSGVATAKEIWQANGGMVVEQEWPLEATRGERNRQVRDMLRRGGNIHYSHLVGGSHNLTWRLAYNFDGVREWLFQQRRPMPAADIQALLRRTDDPTLVVCAQDGDAHGTTPGSIHAIEKAVMKGALMARIALTEVDGQLCLASGQPLDTALDTIGQSILLLVDPQTEARAKAIETLAQGKGRTDQFVLYGSSYGTGLSHIAHVDLDHGSLADVDAALALQPLAVCLTYSSDNNALLADAIARVQTSSRVCMDATQAGLAGSHGDNAERGGGPSGKPGEGPSGAPSGGPDRAPNGGPSPDDGFDNAWGALFDMGCTVLITNQIKPVLNRIK